MTRETVAGPWYFHLSGKYEMGEEKPEEELMGKRKSSPRLDRPYRVLSLFIVAKACLFIQQFDMFYQEIKFEGAKYANNSWKC
jgi:hypothetical protein